MSAKADDFIEFPPDFGMTHAENRAIQIDVLAAREFRMKTGSDFEKARDTTLDRNAPGARLGDARENFQQGRLACTVAADDAENLATLDVKAHILERPEFLDGFAGDDRSAMQDVAGLAFQGISRRAQVTSRSAT